MDRSLILASSSRYRAKVLLDAGIAVKTCAPDYDERAAELEIGPCPPDLLASRLAEGKARSVKARHPDALILGSDQIVVLDGVVLHKPGSLPAAVEQLVQLAGRTHNLVSAVALLDARTDEVFHAQVAYTMKMRTVPRAAIERYVKHDKPDDCAGSYRIESAGIALFEAMDGPDYTAVLGLPVSAVVTLLERAGVPLYAWLDA